MKKLGLILCVITLFFSVCLPAFAHISSSAKWGTSTVYYYPNFAGNDAINRTIESANDWNSKVPDFNFSYTSSGGHTLIMGPLDNGTIAQTTPSFGDDGYLDDSDTVFSTFYTWNWSTSPPSSSQMDFLTICKHELGHWYKLIDCYDLSHSTTMMYGNFSTGQRRSIVAHDYEPAQSMY